MITIYHNARCSKSRCGLEIIENSGKPFEVINYMKNVPTRAELKALIKLLKIKPINLVRKKEALWISKYKDKELTDAMIINAMVENPKLIERPIIVNNNQAIIGRPPETIIDFI